MMAENKSLEECLLNIIDDGKYHSVDIMKKICQCTSVELKEALLRLLQKRNVLCRGSRWKIIRKKGDEQKQNGNRTELFVKCPKCKTALAIEREYIGMRVSCICCNTAFYISSRQCALNEYKAILERNVCHE